MAIIKTAITKINRYWSYDNGLGQDKMTFDSLITIPKRKHNDNGEDIRYDIYRNEGIIFNKSFDNFSWEEINDGMTYFQIVYQTSNGYIEVLDINRFSQVLDSSIMYWSIPLQNYSAKIPPKYEVHDRVKDYESESA
tara:strand:+ start:49 stop:459 length:411 start_codon:yes stop_codon:yes gene_type:complete